jgi:hypothetical protein
MGDSRREDMKMPLKARQKGHTGKWEMESGKSKYRKGKSTKGQAVKGQGLERCSRDEGARPAGHASRTRGPVPGGVSRRSLGRGPSGVSGIAFQAWPQRALALYHHCWTDQSVTGLQLDEILSPVCQTDYVLMARRSGQCSHWRSIMLRPMLY